MQVRIKNFALRISLAYLMVSVAYIYFSDLLLNVSVAQDSLLYLRISMIKGWLFVLVTAILIYFSVNQVLRKLQEANRFSRHTLDALTEHVAVLDENGTILTVNEAWRKFARENGASIESVCEGSSYFDVCEKAIAVGNDDALIISNAIKEVMDGKQKSYFHEYSCHSPTEKRWFVICVTFFSEEGMQRIVVSHENVTHRKIAEEKLVYQARHDSLTGLPNRESFGEKFSVEAARAARYDAKLALLIIDVDRLKIVNDAYGQSAGDLILKDVSTRLRKVIREVDFVGRHDGGQFLALIGSIKDPKDAARAATRIISEIYAQPFSVKESSLTITVSVGISVFPEHGTLIEDLVVNSGVALRRVKQLGHNNYGFYSEGMGVSAIEALTLEQDLRRATGSDQLYPVFQPQLDLTANKLVGFEALARWKHPKIGEISPGRFIPIAEESGIILEIGDWMLRQACLQNQKWVSQGVARVPVSVNVSALQFRQTNFVERLECILEETKLDPSLLELELTESVLIDDSKALLETLHQLNEMGVLLSLDDFGTGYSSLSYLRRFPIHRLKVDKSFISDLPHNKDSVAITGTIIAMSKSLGLQVIAEGVESLEQADFLKSIGCHEVQGYLYGKPMTASDVESWVKSNNSPPVLFAS